MRANRVFYAANCVRGAGTRRQSRLCPLVCARRRKSSLLTLFSALYEDLTFFPRLALDVRGNFPHNKNGQKDFRPCCLSMGRYRKEISTMNEELELLREKKGFICDMDGVIYHGNRLLPGVTRIRGLATARRTRSFLFLTNSSERSPLELQQKLARMGLDDRRGAFLYHLRWPRRSSSRSQTPGRIGVCNRRARSGQCALRGGHHDERCEPRLCDRRARRDTYNYRDHHSRRSTLMQQGRAPDRRPTPI